MESSSEPKAKSRSISLLPDVWKDVDLIAQKSYGRIVSRYIKALIDADIFHDAHGHAYSKLTSRAMKPGGDEEVFAAQLKRAFGRADVREDLIGMITEAVRKAVESSQPGDTASRKVRVRRQK